MTYYPVISHQYITKERINVTILDMIDPAHFVVREAPDLSNATSEAIRFLEAEKAMQKYYASNETSFSQLPLKDAIIVVLYKEKFYRGKVISILTLSAGHLFKVYLVDYGIQCSVPWENIYEIDRDFLRHPFQAVNIKLLGIEPISLVMDEIYLTMSYGPVRDWDPSAGIFIKELQKNVCSVYIEVQGTDDLHIYGRLYLCYENSLTKCINDELVSKQFARFNEEYCKKINKIESILGDSEITCSASTVQASKSENVNLEQVPCTANLSETDIFSGVFKMKFINPLDGEIVAESSFTENSAKKLSVDEEFELQNQSCPSKEVIADLHKVENKSPIETDPKTEAQLLAEKRLKKLQQLKRKSASPGSLSNKNVSAIKTPTSEKSISLDIEEADKVIIEKDYSPNKIETSNYLLNNVLVDSCQDQLSDNSIQDTPKSIPRQESESNAQTLAEKRFKKLQQLKRKSVSPGSIGNKNVSAMKTPISESSISLNREEANNVIIEKDDSPSKIETSNDRLNNLPDDSCQDKASDSSIQDNPKSIPKQESESIVMSENMRQLLKLQRKVRLKQQKESLQVIEKPNEELSVNTSCNSSVCDSDSGLNSFSSSPSTSDRIER